LLKIPAHYRDIWTTGLSFCALPTSISSLIGLHSGYRTLGKKGLKGKTWSAGQGVPLSPPTLFPDTSVTQLECPCAYWLFLGVIVWFLYISFCLSRKIVFTQYILVFKNYLEYCTVIKVSPVIAGIPPLWDKT
jgi:hypothetical protein